MPTLADKIDSLKTRNDLVLAAKKYVRPERNIRPYQVLGATLVWLCPKFLLADSCGLGKTPQTLLAYAIQREIDEGNGVKPPRLLVVTEKSAVLQWPEEVDFFLQGVTSRFIPAAKKIKGFKTPKEYREHLYQTSTEDIITMSHAIFRGDWKLGILLDLVKDSILVLDEADLIRSADSKIFQAIKTASKCARGFKALTATPIYKGLEDYYNLMQVVAPGLFGGRDRFLREYCILKRIKVKTKKGGSMWIDQVDDFKNVEQFSHVARHFMLMRTPEDVGSELPELIEKPVFLEMDPKQRRIYQAAAEGEFNLLPGTEEPRKKEDGEMETPEEVQKRLERTQESKLVTMVRSMQAANSPQVLGQDAPSVKIEKLIQLLKGDLRGEHVVVFSQSFKCIEAIEEALAAEEIETLRITGAESTAEIRNEIRKKFVAPGPPYVLLGTSAIKKALNLQASGTLVLFDQPLSWGDMYQLIGRIRRIGSAKSHALVIRLMCRDTVDEWVYKILSKEDDLVQRCLKITGTMTVTPHLLSYVIAQVKGGKDMQQALESFVGAHKR